MVTIIKYLGILSLSCLVITCSSAAPRKAKYVSPVQPDRNRDAPPSVAIMPFDNNTSEDGIEILVRKSFYNHFSSKNYRDIELTEIDRGLRILANNSLSSWRDLTPAELGNFFHADFLIYGRVKEFKKVFLGIYSQIILRLELEMIDCVHGNLFFGKTIIKRSHEGGLPFSLFGIIPATLRSSLHMKKEKTVDLVESASRDLVEQIPEFPYSGDLPYPIDIQVASFLEEELARRTLKEFEGRGLRPRIEAVTLEGRIWHRIILGPYFSMPEAEKARDGILRGTAFKPILIRPSPETSREKR